MAGDASTLTFSDSNGQTAPRCHRPAWPGDPVFRDGCCELSGRGLLDAPHSRGMTTEWAHLRIPATLTRPSPASEASSREERAQGMPGVWLHPQPCVRIKKAHKHSHHRYRRNIDIPCAMVLTAYIVRAPARPAFVSPSLAHHRSASLAPASRAPGPHALAVRVATLVLRRFASIASRAPRVVTIAIRPSSSRRDESIDISSSEKRKRNIFAQMA
jgi:hypothetical protein